MHSSFFHPVTGIARFAWYAGAVAFSVLIIFLLQLVPQRFRRYVILSATFVGGLFYALEFLLPVHLMRTKADPLHMGNFLTPYLVPFGVFTQIVFAATVGLGVINMLQVHGKRLIRRGKDSAFSLAFLISFALMLLVTLLKKVHPNAINANYYRLLFDGALQSLDATMFSVVAFYIVSAAYRAFRVRSPEATMLLVTAILVMLGQIAIGILLTSFLPKTGVWHNLRFEIIRDWILRKANAPSIRAIQFGLGIGSLAVALRIWLGLERGSYFENQG